MLSSHTTPVMHFLISQHRVTRNIHGPTVKPVAIRGNKPPCHVKFLRSCDNSLTALHLTAVLSLPVSRQPYDSPVSVRKSIALRQYSLCSQVDTLISVTIKRRRILTTWRSICCYRVANPVIPRISAKVLTDHIPTGVRRKTFCTLLNHLGPSLGA